MEKLVISKKVGKTNQAIIIADMAELRQNEYFMKSAFFISIYEVCMVEVQKFSGTIVSPSTSLHPQTKIYIGVKKLSSYKFFYRF